MIWCKAIAQQSVLSLLLSPPSSLLPPPLLKKKRDLFITGIFPARKLFFITVLNKFQKIAAGENYSHYSFILIPKQKGCNCNDFAKHGNRVIQHNHKKGDFCRHFRQLFYQLRSTQNRAHRDVLGVDLRHFDNRLGNGRQTRGEELEHVLQLFHRLRHRIVEKRHQRDCVDDLFHGAPLYPCLRTGQGSDPVRPNPFGVLVKQIEEHRIHPGVGRPLAPWRVVRLRPCTSERRVVQGCGQLHAHGHPLVSKKRAEPALPPPPCGARNMGAISTRAIRWVLNHHGHTNKETRACVIHLLLLLLLLF